MSAGADDGANTGAGNGMFRSLAHRNFRLFMGGQLVSQCGTWLTNIAQVLLVLHLTDDSGVAVGALLACQYVPMLLLGAWAGVITDRTDKRRLLLVVQTCSMGQSFVMAALAFMDRPPLAAIYVTALAGGVAVAFDSPARRTIVTEMVPTSDLPNAISLNSAVITGSRIFGPALAGLLVQTVGYGWCFTIDGFSYLAVIISLWAINVSELTRSPAAEREKGMIRQGLRYAWSESNLRVPLVIATVVGVLSYNFQVILPLFVTQSIDSSESAFTLMYTFISVGSVIGALVSAKRTTVTIRTVAASSALFGTAIGVFALSPDVAVAFAFAVFIGFASMMFNTSVTAIVQIEAAPSMRGRVLALQGIVFLGSTPIGGPIMGVISDFANPRIAFAVGAVAGLGAAAWGLTVDRRSTPVDGERPSTAAEPAGGHPEMSVSGSDGEEIR